MSLYRFTLALFVAAVASFSAVASSYQVTACIVADTKGNPSYFGTATTKTQLKCELGSNAGTPTLIDLYKQGWRLIDIVGGNHAISLGNRGPSPLYLLERELKAPANKAPAKKK